MNDNTLQTDARANFLHNVRQIKNTAILMRRIDATRMEPVYVSEDFAKMMECSVEEAVRLLRGEGYLRTTAAGDRLQVRSMLEKRESAEGEPSITIQKITARGRWIWCNVHFSFIDDFGERYVYCTYFDVTALKEQEERLRSGYITMGNNFYQNGDSVLGMFRVNLSRDVVEDIQGKDLYSSDRMDHTWSEIIAERAKFLPVEEEKEEFLDIYDRLSLVKRFMDGEMQIALTFYTTRADGRHCFVEYAVSMTHHPTSGEVVAFITEKESNNEKVGEILQNRILSNQYDMVAYLVDGKYGVAIGDMFANRQNSLFPLRRRGDYEHYLTNQVEPLIYSTPEERAEMIESLRMETVIKRTAEVEPYEVNVMCRTGGEIRYKQFDFYRIDENEGFYIVLKRDITEAYQEQLERNRILSEALKEARQASVAKTAFLSSMSHEIRTPMNAIIGMNKLALTDETLSEKTRKQLNQVDESARYLLSLINDVLDMSRIESGRMVLKSEEFAFAELLAQINNIIGSQCRDRGLTYECKLLSEMDDFYIGEDMKLKQVLINILGNAVKFTPAPGTVSLSVEKKVQSDTYTNVQFVVSDTGIGMDKSFLPKVFDSFTQEDATTRNAYGGSGLGLALTKNMVEMMNGHIEVDSEKGKGSTFTIDVMLKNSAHSLQKMEEEDEEEPQEGTLSGRRILLAEDMMINAEIMKQLLSMQEIECEHAENGKLAVELFDSHPEGYFDAILMDIRMPVMDGLQATEAIRALERPDAKQIPIIAMTANAFDEDVQNSLHAGMNMHLSKPVEPELLFKALRKMIR